MTGDAPASFVFEWAPAGEVVTGQLLDSFGWLELEPAREIGPVAIDGFFSATDVTVLVRHPDAEGISPLRRPCDDDRAGGFAVALRP